MTKKDENELIIKIKEFDIDLIAPSTKKMYDKDQGGSKIVVIGKPGCFAEGTKILMYNGSVKNVEDVEVGDSIMGDDSTPRYVLELCTGRDEMYKIIPRYYEPYVVNRLHKLVLLKQNVSSKNLDNIREITVEDFLKESSKEDWVIFKRDVKFKHNKESFTAVLNNDPYQLGLSLNKIIPSEYKINSVQFRLKLLAGILDCNNAVYNKISKIYKFLHYDKDYISDIFFLSSSLGFGSFTFMKEEAIFSEDNEKVSEFHYECYIQDLGQIPTKEKEIIDRNEDENIYNLNTFKIELVGEDNYYGFILDGNHRFMLSTFDVVRNTGKTTLISSLLYEKRNIFPVAKVFSGTEDSNHYYQSIFPSSFVFNHLVDEEVVDFVKRQKISKQYLKNPWAVLLLDDCTDDPGVFKKPLYQNLYKNGRHFKCLFILSLQYALDVKPVIRTNIDGTFILRETNLRNRRVLYENYGSVIPDFNTFCTILDEICDDYTALYIHNATTSNKFEDCIFYYKAKPIPKGFKFGCRDYWEFHKERYNDDYVDPIMA